VRDPFGLRDLDDPDGTGDEEGDGSVSLGRRVRVALAVALVVVVLALATAGPAGLLVALSAAAVGAVLVLSLRLPGPPPRRGRGRPGPPVDNAPFRAYRKVADQLSWAAVSPRHYDMITRPLLIQLAASRLADRHRVDLRADPAAARAILGEDVWPWVDPDRPASRNSQPPGVGADTLTLIVDRLEHL
jgi:hypothetical protein